jgi:Peptidase family M41/C-terminal, D2-small domain, of ClpB protein
MKFQDLSIKEKRQLLDNACAELKKEFVGLDNIIDEVADTMLPWWLFPQHQMRPLIINLWGMTGSGKTALIKRLSELIQYNNLLLRFDMGEFGNNSSFLKYTLTGQLEQFNNSAPIIVLDEFQFAKTKDENGKEVNNTSLRIIWDLLDSGELLYEPSVNTYYLNRGKKAIGLLKALKKQNITLKDGLVKKNAQEIYKLFNDNQFGYVTESPAPDAEKVEPKYEEVFLSDFFLTGWFELNNSKLHVWQELRDIVKAMNSIDDLIKAIEQDIEEAIALRKMNLSKSLIFVVGNLDEAYSMSHNINPDIDADEFKRHTLKINIADIKAALQTRFRNEQIARLGNNHLIYHAFSHAEFAALIQMHLTLLSKQILERFKLKVTFTQAVKDMLYAEGVFPTQGVRPVISTLRNHIESNIAKIMLHVMQVKVAPKTLVWDFENNNFDIKFNTGTALKLPVVQKINNLRKTTKSDLQAIVAVHEAGHTLAAMFVANVVPEYVITRTVDSDSNGFAYTILPEDIVTKRLMLDRIVLFLGGYAAEQYLYGELNNTTGVYDDFNKATMMAQQMIRDFGMTGLPYRSNIHVYGGSPYQMTFTEELEQQSKDLMHASLDKVLEVLKEHEPFFIMLSTYLSDNSRIDKVDIIAMYHTYCKKYKVPTINFVTKDTYYDFRKKLHAKFKKLK